MSENIPKNVRILQFTKNALAALVYLLVLPEAKFRVDDYISVRRPNNAVQ